MNVNEIIELFNQKDWRFSKTSKFKNPHWYTLRENWDDDPTFDLIVNFIRNNGIEESFWNIKYICLHHNGWKYWTMGSPVDKTTLINKTFVSEQYNKIAYQYENTFTDEYSLKENVVVTNMFKDIITPEMSILDVGSGTGMLLNYIETSPEKYVGIDPSYPMVKLAREKYPEFIKSFKYDKFETHLKKYDLIVSLFGSMNYVIDLYLDHLYEKLNPEGKYFLMFYKESYTPITYQKTKTELYHFKYDKSALKSIYTDCTIIEFNNYYIVTNL
jgi:2-polyprenyl-3-methyl-5-hydroxy-6-metoxy-1,4-benzoquinol methylase